MGSSTISARSFFVISTPGSKELPHWACGADQMRRADFTAERKSFVRTCPATPGPQARRDDAQAMHGGACVRHAQTLDGLDALPDEETGAREHRDESARAGIQPEAGDRD